MSERRHERSAQHPAMRQFDRAVMSGSIDESPTGEISWPLVDRRRRTDAPPDGVDRRRPDSRLGRLSRWRRRPPSEAARVARLLRANDLLVELRKISLTIPQEFDIDLVLDRGVERTRELSEQPLVTILLCDDLADQHDALVTVRGRGSDARTRWSKTSLPEPARLALDGNRSFRSSFSDGGIAREAREGVYSALRARGRTIGLIALETRSVGDLDETVTEVITGIADALALGIDNARLVSDIRRRAEDEMRIRIARDLHDRTGGTLAAIGFEVDRLLARSAATGDTSEVHETLQSIRRELTGVISELRELLTDLRTVEVPTDRFAVEMRALVDRVGRRSGLTASCEIDPDIRLDGTQSSELFVIVKEALLNVERHARADAFRVATRREGSNWILEIIDNGRGFDVASIAADSHGISGMTERATMIGARFSIESGRDGTTVRVSWPQGSLAT